MEAIPAERWKRIEELWDQALDRPAEERDAFLREACAGDEALRAEVRRLLDSGEGMSWLDRPVGSLAAPLMEDVAVSATDELPAFKRVGPYRILSEAGRGGMGVVYVAERDDGHFQMRVALKLLRASLAWDPGLTRRFLHERQILARLQHPWIARLLDGGVTDDGHPFFVMEYVDGLPVDRYCDERGLGVEERLRLFVRILDAVAHAHRTGVVHRDLKPSNILVTAEGDPKLLDFGIAKPLEPETGHAATLTGARMLTPEYASPEQIRGETVTAASDVYSLGVILYQLLTGKRPYRRAAADRAGLEAAVLGEEPTRPSQAVTDRLRRRLRGDLDTIVLTAIRKDPAERYESAESLADDIRRHLDGKPIEGRPESLARRVVRAIRRRRALALIAAAVVLLAVTVFATLRLSRTSEPSIPTVAVLPFRHVGDSAGRYFTDGLTEEVTSRLAGLAGLGVISRRSADQYRDDPRPLREIGSELRADYVLEGSVRWTPEGVRVTPRLVRVRDDRSIWDRTLDAEGTEALAVQGRIAGEVAGALQVALSSRERRGVERPATASEAAYDYYLRGNEYFARSNQHDDMAGAEALYTRALEEDPGFAQAQARLARVNVGMYWFGHDRVPERLTRARALIDSALAADPELPEARLALGYWYYWGRRDYPRAIAELERLRRLQPNNGEVLAAMAYVERRMGRWSDAAAHLSAAVALDPRSNARAHDLGDTYLSMRDYDAAERMFQRAIALAPDWPVPYVYYANLQVLRNGDFAAAHAVVQEALRHMSPGRLAGALLMVERTGVSIVTTDTALARQMAAIPLDAFQGDTAWYHLFQADLAHARGDRAATRRHADEARAVFEARLAANPGAFPNHASLGLAHAFAGNRDAALASARRATELLPIAADANSGPFLVSTLARIHVLTGDPAAALPLLARLLQIPSWISPASLQHDPVWEGIRQVPGYREQLRLRQPM